MTKKQLKRHTYKATCPDGRVITRTTERVYTHVALVYSAGWNEHNPSWGALGWCGRLDLAEKQCKKWAGLGETRIVEVDNPR